MPDAVRVVKVHEDALFVHISIVGRGFALVRRFNDDEEIPGRHPKDEHY